MTTRQWKNITDYMDTVGTTLKTFTFNKTQNFVQVTLRGNANVTYAIGSQSGTLTPGQSISVSEIITSFTLTAVSGTQTIEVWATENGTQKVEDGSYDADVRREGVPYAINLKNGLANWRRKFSNLQSVLNITIVGDSISEGAKATPSYRNNGYVGLLRNYFNSAYGDVGGGYVPSYHAYDIPLVTKTGTGWANDTFGTTSQSLHTTVLNDYLEFTINAPGVEIFYPTGPVGGIMQVSVDGVVYGTVNQYSASVIATNIYTVSGLTNGPHTIRITFSTLGGGTMFFNGFREIKGSSGIRVNMGARWGIVASQAIGGPSLDTYTKLNPDLTIIAMVANDSNSQTALTTYATNIQSIITNAKANGGDVLILANGLHNPNATPIDESSYVGVLTGLALMNNCGFIDINKSWSNNGVIANQMGYYSDNVHPNNTGHQFYYNTILNAIT